MNSPLESPDIMQTFIPLSEIGATNTSMASIKLSSADSINVRHHQHLHHHQVRPILLQSNYSSSSTFYQIPNFQSGGGGGLPSSSSTVIGAGTGSSSIAPSLGDHPFTDNNNSKSLSAIPEVVLESVDGQMASTASVDTSVVAIGRKPTTLRFQMSTEQYTQTCRPSLVDFNLNSVGRSFIDDFDDDIDPSAGTSADSLHTPETPTPNISPSSSNRFSETFSNDFQQKVSSSSTPSIVVSPLLEVADGSLATTMTAMQPPTVLRIPNGSGSVRTNPFCGSWDLLELDLDFHDVNFDPSFGGDLEECIFFGDDPLGLLPAYPTAPDAFDL